MMDKVCPTCGKTFTRKTNRQKYCSIECRVHSRKIIEIRKCIACGKEFEITSQNKDKIFCSAECHDHGKAYKSKCIICGKEFDSYSSNTKYCSSKCRHFNPDKKRKCCYCGKTFFPRVGHDNQKYCSLKCRNEHPRVTKIKKHCLNCGKEIEVWPCVAERTKYCSVECQMIGGHSNTDIELIVKNWLTIKNIKFTQQYEVGKYFADFFLDDYNIIIEVQGDYWHGNPLIYSKNELNAQQIDHMKRDKRKFGFYKHNHFKFYELWGKDIKEDIDKTMLIIKELA